MGVFKKYKDRSFWRKIAIATWKHPRDPQVYASLDIDAGAMMKVIAEVREHHGVRLSPVHFVGKGASIALPHYPAMNGIIVRGKIRTREHVDIWFNVAFDEGDLFGAKVERTEDKTVLEIAQALRDGADAVRARKDARLEDHDRITRTVPVFLLKPLLWLTDKLNFSLGLDLSWAGVERDPFGSILITNIGTFDMRHAFAPIPPVMRLPLAVVVGRVHDKPVAVDGEVVVRPILPLSITLDHRYIDGFQGARLAKEFQDYMEDEDALRASLGLGEHDLVAGA